MLRRRQNQSVGRPKGVGRSGGVGRIRASVGLRASVSSEASVDPKASADPGEVGKSWSSRQIQEQSAVLPPKDLSSVRADVFINQALSSRRPLGVYSSAAKYESA